MFTFKTYIYIYIDMYIYIYIYIYYIYITCFNETEFINFLNLIES